MAIYLCRWPNGEFSIVNAKTKDDAIELLDEWGNAEQASLTRMTDCMFDFRLSDDGKIELANIAESTEDHIMKTCYPDLSNALANAEWATASISRLFRSMTAVIAALNLLKKLVFLGTFRGRRHFAILSPPKKPKSPAV